MLNNVVVFGHALVTFSRRFEKKTMTARSRGTEVTAADLDGQTS